VNANSEKFRNTFVDFQGQKELVVICGGNLMTAPVGELAKQLTKEIQKNLVDEKVREWILPAFSTTTNTDEVVCSVVMMATLQKYFKYTIMTMCGLPQVTLLGTTEDYELLKKKVDKLPEYDLGDGMLKEWHALLSPICEELIKSAQGKPELDFWNRICDHHRGSGKDHLSGWLTAFCSFDDEGKWQGTIHSKFKTPFIRTSSVPSGLVSVPVLFDDNGKQYKTVMFAGSFCMDVVTPTKVQPRLDWGMALVDEEALKKNENEKSKRPFY